MNARRGGPKGGSAMQIQLGQNVKSREDHDIGRIRYLIMDPDTQEEVRNLMGKGFAGTVFLTTDDVHASYEELKGRGVEFTEEPEERPYGIDSGFRDPSGNSFRLTELREIPVA